MNIRFQLFISIYLQKDKFSKYSLYIGKHFHTYLISNSQILFIFNTWKIFNILKSKLSIYFILLRKSFS